MFFLFYPKNKTKIKFTVKVPLRDLWLLSSDFKYENLPGIGLSLKTQLVQQVRFKMFNEILETEGLFYQKEY